MILFTVSRVLMNCVILKSKREINASSRSNVTSRLAESNKRLKTNKSDIGEAADQAVASLFSWPGPWHAIYTAELFRLSPSATLKQSEVEDSYPG